MTIYDDLQNVTRGRYLGNKSLINKYLIEPFEIKKVVFYVETTFSRDHFLDPPISLLTVRKGDEWR